ncbi:MAG: RsmB/NOP family class I SAM-dependent RNA methyltransferase [Erythrobacter sp.]|jgi:16S rRNA (cytosine967-C5)-methyltransferase|uniref:RsmB/NOP family class I SAM-dependent RNA methyltransferase n=1 Tax=Erythrobacter sp. TaxID=1042 RepID=UPI002B47B215|nr:RsmB/NOP family class I SAM-dependent RNA methyltransferase [Erythrobacter sp.]WRH71191.1 MAG: RsmB/NOP family class I SAM-dependent RNA methyltransferase [Erythrobacter sp.]
MTPAARIQAAIELLDSIIAAARAKGAPADRIIADYFRARRYAGSKDRRAVRDLVYRAVRLCGPVPASGRAAMLAVVAQEPAIAALFDGSPHGPAPRAEGEEAAKTGLAPKWLAAALRASGLDGRAIAALMDRAPLDIRVNALKADRATLELPEAGEPLAAPQALRYPSGTPVESWEAYGEGLVEVQDLGSQLIIEALPLREGDTVVDLCAGGGGKTLALAARLGNAARIIAADTDKRRLGNLAPRAARAGAAVDEIVLLDPGREMAALAPIAGKADHVLVDAPCSGSGTWRRSPEGRWRLDPAELARLNHLQDRVLDIAAQLVRPSGTIAFVTCSLLDAEGADRITAFLARHPGWQVEPIALMLGASHGPGWRLEPLRDGTDGFFIAALRSP